MKNTHSNPEEVTRLEKLRQPRYDNVIPFPVRKIQKQTSSLLDELTPQQVEASKMMGELPAFKSEAEKQAHIDRINAERQGANECVVLVMNLA